MTGHVRRPRDRVPVAHLVLLLALGTWASGVLWRPEGSVADVVYDLVLYHVVYGAGAWVCWRASRLVPTQRMAWLAFTVTLACHVVGDLTVSALSLRGDLPLASLADVFFLAGYPLTSVAMIGLARARVARFHPSMWLDGLVGALGAGAVAVAVLLGPSSFVDRSLLAAVVGVAYPTGDVLLLVLLVGVVAVLGLRLDRVLVLVGVALICGLVADIVYAQQAATGSYAPGGWLDLLWLLSVPLVAVGAQSVIDDQARSTTPAVRAGGGGWQVLALPMVAALVSVGLLGLGWGSRFPPLAAVLAVCCVIAGMARLGLTFREVRALSGAREQAMTDELTGLPNRRALLAAAGTAIAATRHGRPVALLLLDLDGFKDVNDGLGHHAGDMLLRQLGERLRLALADDRPAATRHLDRAGPAMLARLGGDEFAVLLPGCDVPAAVDRARELLAELVPPFALEQVRVHVGASIGVTAIGDEAVSGWQDDETTVIELLRRADIAMYAAKSRGLGVHAYTARTDGHTGDRLRTMDELHQALDSDQIVIHLQPQVRTVDGAPCGAEALVRWQHPRRGLLGPGDLLPAAAHAGLLLRLADQVLDLALASAAGWWPVHRIPVSVNLAAPNVTDLDLPSKVAAALRRHGLPPDALTLEVVEDTLMTDPQRGRAVLQELQELGVRTSIDDYGTGYSSLAYLRDLPIDELKLDRAFTADLRHDHRARAIVTHTLALAHDLGLLVVAEGIEDQETLTRLTELGCDVAQGFHIARPLPVPEFRDWLDEAVRRAPSEGTGRSVAVYT